MNIPQPRTTIRFTVVTVFVFATALTAGVAIGLQYYFSDSLGRGAAEDLYQVTAQSVAGELDSIRQLNQSVIALAADNRDLATPGMRNETLRTFAGILRHYPLFYGIYIGWEDGRFLELINLHSSPGAYDYLMAIPTDRWVTVEVLETPEGRKRRYHYLDAEFVERATREEATDYDVRTRPWFESALRADDTVASAPYLFSQSGQPGTTISRRIRNTRAVVGIDMTLQNFSDYLADRQISLDSTLYLYAANGLLIATSAGSSTEIDAIPRPEFAISREERKYLDSLGPLVVSNELDWPPVDYAVKGKPRGYSVDVMKLLAGMLGVEIRFENGHSWDQLVALFEEGEIDLLHSAMASEKNARLGLSGRPYASLPFALLTREGTEAVGSLGALGERSLTIPANWSILPMVRETHPEITIVEAESTLDAIEMVANGEAFAALDNEIILNYIISHYFLRGVKVESGIDLEIQDLPNTLSVFVHEDQAELRTLLDRAIAAIGPEQREALHQRWLEPDHQRASVTSETVPIGEFLEATRDPDKEGAIFNVLVDGREHLAFTAELKGEDVAPLYIGILTPTESILAPYLEKVWLSIKLTAGLLLVLLPFSWFFANPIVRPVRQLALENDKVRELEFDKVQRVPSHIRELDELSESMVEMVDSIKAHELAQRELMDSFIELIAQAIDDKSPYTGGHCERVPELALMLAKAANDSSAPPFDAFKLSRDDEWREYRIAAWLHDCGKITTPEHIVDKGSKLEVIYNRIHEVRTRFEVLSRDAEIRFWEQLNGHPEQRDRLEAQLQASQRQLQEDFAFVAECNVGGEYLDEEKQQRLRDIARRTWQRRFDDRIGLSPVEEMRLKGEAPELPVTEQLLADKAEHIIERSQSTDYPPEYGINMDIPEHLYNQGEVYNLSISRGTLTPEDRFKINEHMISTIKMLESLPFPDYLENVPRYASTHHETMRGSGYPRRLPGEDLSIPERILAVADVFEALTASDRPYKKAKPVSVAIDILHNMVEENHIDRDCFELFLRSGVYKRYAETFLDPSQIDEVDIHKYVA